MFEAYENIAWAFPKTLFDLGTGSGILALAAKKFDSQVKITVCDNDPICESEVAKTFNFNNETLEGIQCYFSDASLKSIKEKNGSFDCIVSNIYAEVLVGMLPDIYSLLANGGRWLVSGILGGASQDLLVKSAENLFSITWQDSLERPSVYQSPGEVVSFERWYAFEFAKK